MNSLVLVILIVSSVFGLGYGNNLAVSLDYPAQKTEVNTHFNNFVAPANNIVNLVDSVQPIPNSLLLDSLYAIEVSISGTEWNWGIRKYGVFSCEVMSCLVSSPYDVLINFEGFDNLTDIVSNSQINTMYAISQSVPPPPKSDDWISARDLNSADFTIPVPAGGVIWNLWCLLDVTNQVRSGEYNNHPTITFVLPAIVDWIDPQLSLMPRFENPKARINQGR